MPVAEVGNELALFGLEGAASLGELLGLLGERAAHHGAAAELVERALEAVVSDGEAELAHEGIGDLSPFYGL
jgi:hypothetical protein